MRFLILHYTILKFKIVKINCQITITITPSLKTLTDGVIMLFFSELSLAVYFNHFELENCLMTTPKHR